MTWCVKCEKGVYLKRVKTETWIIRKKPITLDVEHFWCPLCGDEVFIPTAQEDPFKKAYKLYEEKYGEKIVRRK